MIKYHDIYVDLDRHDDKPFDAIQRGEKDSRGLYIHLLKSCKTYTIPEGISVKIQYDKPDGKSVLADDTTEKKIVQIDYVNNRIILDYVEQMATTEGVCNCKLGLYTFNVETGTYSILKTAMFSVSVLDGMIDESLIVDSSDEYDSIIASLERLKTIELSESERQSNELDRQQAETQREQDFDTAIENAETATANANTATDKANTATDNANVATGNANDAGDYANEQGDYAKEEGDAAVAATTRANTATDNANLATAYANTQGDYAKSQGNLAATATTNTNTATANANTAASNANTAKTNADTATDNANSAATYANTQGTYAKEQGDAAKVIIDNAGDLNDIIDRLDTVEQNTRDDREILSGEFINYQDSVDSLVQITELDGKSTQVVTVQGKNLIDYNKVINNNLESMTVSGSEITAMGKIGYCRFYWKLPSELKGKVVSVSYTTIEDTCIAKSLRIKVIKEDSSIVYLVFQKQAAGGVISIPSDVKDIQLDFLLNNTSSALESAVKLKISNIQVEIGSTATEYEPFVPDSPSPEYPSPILSVGDSNFDIVSCGKNLLNLQNGTYVNKGVTVVVIDGTISVSGTTNSSDVSFINIPIVNKIRLKAGEHILSLNNNVAYTGQEIIRLQDGASVVKGSVSLSNVNNTTKFVLEEPYIPTVLTVRTGVGTTVSYVAKPQVELSSTTTYYEPYTDDRTTIDTPNQKFRSLQNGVTDGWGYNENGEYGYWQRVGFAEYDGSTDEMWQKSINTEVDRFFIPVAESKKPSNSGFISHFKYQYPLSTALLKGLIDGNGNFFVNYTTPGTTTLTDWKAWLSVNPIKVQYELETPIFTPMSEIFLKSFKPTTHIFTTATIQPELSGIFKSEFWSRDYLKDIEIEKINEVITVTVPTSGWSETIPYTQTISVEGLKESSNPVLDLDIPLETASADAKALVKNYSMLDSAVTANGTLTLYCYSKKPAIDFNLKLKGV